MEIVKSPAPDGNQTNDLTVLRHALYHCATTPVHKLLRYFRTITKFVLPSGVLQCLSKGVRSLYEP